MRPHPPTAFARSGRKGVAAACFMLMLALAGPVCTPAAAEQERPVEKARAKPAQIDRNGVLILTRSTLLALDHANKTGNYTVLRDLGSAGFQTKSAAELAEIFSSQRKQALDFGAVAVLEPQLTLLPQIEPNGMLHMAGFFPSMPMQVNFELLFEPVNRQWKIFGVAVNLTPGGPQAPDKPAGGSARPKPPEPPPDAPSASVGAPKKTRPIKP